MSGIKFIRDVSRLGGLSIPEKKSLAKVTEQYQFRTNDYYISLINWNDPNDPIRRIIVPQKGELVDTGQLDASDEKSNYVAPGLQHKYPHTALLIVTEICGGYCRFCFRKRLFMKDSKETPRDLTKAINYIRETGRIRHVLLSGGDPLILSTERLEKIISELRKINHVEVIRIGTKMPAFNPYRIINDSNLIELISRYSYPQKRIYIMTHFNAPEELTTPANRAVAMLQKAGAVICNQTPLLRGINDDPNRLALLMRKLTSSGVMPYYFFQCRPTAGNHPFTLPIVEAYRIFEAAKAKVSGLDKRARLVMSHHSGKIDIMGVTESHIYLKYQRARLACDEGRFMVYHRDDKAYWLEDLVPTDETRKKDPAVKYCLPDVSRPISEIRNCWNFIIDNNFRNSGNY